jgi:hypothetical protein
MGRFLYYGFQGQCGTLATWPELCVGVFAKFNRDKYAKFMDAFFAHKQTGSVIRTQI